MRVGFICAPLCREALFVYCIQFMPNLSADVVICGAGIAGIATAYHLAVTHGMQNVVLLEAADPLSLTSDKSTEAYRNWWPGPYTSAKSEKGRAYVGAMTALVNRSLDWLETLATESEGRIRMFQQGYLYVTARAEGVEAFRQAGQDGQSIGAGPLRLHNTADSPYQSGVVNGLDGADLITHPDLIHQHFPYLAPQTKAVLHVRRAGWFTAQQMGMYLLEQARAQGVQLLRGKLSGVDIANGKIQGLEATHEGQTFQIQTSKLVNAAGPMQVEVAKLMGTELPVVGELHFKMSFPDNLKTIPRTSPMLIWTDSGPLPWSPEECQMLSEDPQNQWMLAEMPAGVHGRPDGHGESTQFFLLYNPKHQAVEPTFPIKPADHYTDLALRALSVMVPGIAGYLERTPKPYIDGGYYMRTEENRPLVGPMGVDGGYVIGALGGFGLMAACAAGELLAAHISGSPLPDYAPAFALSRYQDPEYMELLEHWGDGAQL